MTAAHDVGGSEMRDAGSSRHAGHHTAVRERLDSALDDAGAADDRWNAWVPGRIEIFGKHTDYAGGRSLLCAVERGFSVRAARRPDKVVKVADVATGVTHITALDAQADSSPGHWGTYVDVVVRRIARNFPRAGTGMDMAFSSDLPKAAGLSSSSALVVATFLTLARANSLDAFPEYRATIHSPEDLAAYLGSVENGYAFGSLDGEAGVGTFGGSEDHLAMLCSQAEHVIQYSFLPVRRIGAYRLGEDYVFAIAASGVTAEKSGAAREQYNRLSRMTRALLAEWNRATSRSDISLGAAASSEPDAAAHLGEIAAKGGLDGFGGPELVARLEQFLVESFELVPAAGAALAAGDWPLFGALAERSQQLGHESLGNQIPETLALANSARELGAVAASPFGAGFGGSVWALVATRSAGTFVAHWRDAYRRAFPDRASASEFFVTRAGPGAHVW